MPNIKLHTPVDKQQIRAILERRCPDLDLGTLGPSLTASTSPWVAAMINVNRKTVSIAPAVANLKMFLLFLAIALTGLGIVLYAVLAAPKQLALVKRVSAALKEELPVAGR